MDLQLLQSGLATRHPLCVECELHDQGDDIPKSVGLGSIHLPQSLPIGSGNPAILFIGQNPGWNEDQKGVPFIGKSGNILRKAIIAGANLATRSSVYITNGVRCHTMGNETPTKKHFKACIPYTLSDIKELGKLHKSAKMAIVTLGSPATDAFYRHGLHLKNVSLSDAFSMQGRQYSPPFAARELTVFSTYHPAYILRNNNHIHAVSDHMQLVSDWLDDCLPQPSVPDIVRSFDPPKE